MADNPRAEGSVDRTRQAGPWIVIAVLAVGLSLFFTTVVGLIVVATRPTVDEVALQQLIDEAVAARMGTPAPSGTAASPPPNEIPDGFFSLAQVATHGDPTSSCWVVVDGKVFDLTEASRLHPAQFTNCGADSSEVYHRQHGATIRDQMMAYHIGDVWTDGMAMPTATPDGGGTGTIVPEGCPPEQIGGPIDPVTTIFVDEPWDPGELMLVVEKDCRSVIFFDGSSHELVGRIDDVGHQLHAPTPSPDGRYVYMVARDGWVSKVDLETLEVVASIDVGVSSRGTGVTDDGRYLLVGNFDPNTAVLLDAVTMEVVRTFEATGSVNDGPEQPSKVGGIAQLGTKLYMVLKDVNAVWEIETADPTFPVRKYENLGEGQTPLHDIFLTPDGRYVLVAVQGANVVWVLDTETGEEVAEVPTAVTPHTGPGATVGNLTFVPTLDPEGVISVIDNTTWTNVANLDVGGPGLFIRHNPTAESAEEYPYVWGETAFGDFHDEIYVIDVRSLEIVETLRPVPGESSWHPEFTYDGSAVYVVSQTGNAVVVYDSESFEEIARIEAKTPSAVFNMGIRRHEAGL
jgi:YVTN family beta-propeller protein